MEGAGPESAEASKSRACPLEVTRYKVIHVGTHARRRPAKSVSIVPARRADANVPYVLQPSESPARPYETVTALLGRTLRKDCLKKRG